MVDVSRGTTGNVLPASVSNEIWQKVQSASVVQQLARRIDVPGNGLSIPMISGAATAYWVDETAEKPVSKPTLGSKSVTAYMIEVTVPFSNQFRRDNARLFSAISDSLPGAIADKYDRTVFGEFSAPGANFDTLASVPTAEIGTTDPYDDYLTAVETVGDTNDAEVTAWVLSRSAQVAALRSRNALGQPLLQAGTVVEVPVVLSNRVKGVEGTLGLGGDWLGSAVWGQVGTINYSESDQASIPDPDNEGEYLHLWSRNMFAVRFEVELAFRIRSADDFIRLTTPAGP